MLTMLSTRAGEYKEKKEKCFLLLYARTRA
jgi:hypothetical protein